jgi:hypothetical protein
MTPPKKPVKPSVLPSKRIDELEKRYCGPYTLLEDKYMLRVNAIIQFLDEQHEAKEGV